MQDSEFVIQDATGDKDAGRIANLSSGMQPVTKTLGRIANLLSRTQPETKTWGRIANLSSETQPETNSEVGQLICHSGCNQRQIARQDGELSSRMQPETTAGQDSEFDICDATGDTL